MDEERHTRCFEGRSGLLGDWEAYMSPFETALIPRQIWARLGYHDRTKRLVEYLEANPTENLSLARAADVAGMERTALSRYFRQRIGLRFSDFLRAYRVALAIREMEHHDRSVSEVAHGLGYRCVKTFERDFRRITATCPSAYRTRLYRQAAIAPRRDSSE